MRDTPTVSLHVGIFITSGQCWGGYTGRNIQQTGLRASRTRHLLLKILKVVSLSYGFILIQLMRFHSEDVLFFRNVIIRVRKKWHA